MKNTAKIVPIKEEAKADDVEEITTQPVALVFVEMPFWNMVMFMVKAALAAIPAGIILAGIAVVAMKIFNDIAGAT